MQTLECKLIASLFLYCTIMCASVTFVAYCLCLIGGKQVLRINDFLPTPIHMYTYTEQACMHSLSLAPAKIVGLLLWCGRKNFLEAPRAAAVEVGR